MSLSKTVYCLLSTGSTKETRECPDTTKKLLAGTLSINTSKNKVSSSDALKGVNSSF